MLNDIGPRGGEKGLKKERKVPGSANLRSSEGVMFSDSSLSRGLRDHEKTGGGRLKGSHAKKRGLGAWMGLSQKLDKGGFREGNDDKEKNCFGINKRSRSITWRAFLKGGASGKRRGYQEKPSWKERILRGVLLSNCQHSPFRGPAILRMGEKGGGTRGGREKGSGSPREKKTGKDVSKGKRGVF